MRLISAVLIALSAAGCATNPVTGKQDLVLVSEAQELALGRQAHQQTLSEYGVYNDQALQQYVDAVGQRLAAVSHRPDLTYTFTVLDSPQINAFALPGGYIYITRGIMAFLNSEAELAAVLGHEIGHVTARHGVRQASSAQATSIGAGLLSVFMPEMGAGLGQTLGTLSTALLRGYGREHELEADRLGADYIADTGYDPQAMFAVIRTLKNQEILDQKLAAAEGRQPRAYHGLFATHPDNDKRLQEIVQHAGSESGGGEWQRDRFLNQIDGLVFGVDPAQGFLHQGRFVHPDLDASFAVPRDWQMQNNPDHIVFGPPQQNAMVLVRIVRVSEGESAADALAKAGVTQLARAEAISPGGFAGVTGLTQIKLGGKTVPARVSAVVQGNRAWIFAGAVADAGQLGALDPTLRAFAESFRTVSSAERAAGQPRRLAVTRLQGPVSWAALARGSPLKKLPEDQLRMLNAATGDSAPAGARIKVIK